MIGLIFHSILILALAYIARPGHFKWVYWSAFSWKLSLGIALGLIYFYILGGGDTVLFHKGSMEMYELAKSNFSDYISRLFTSEYHIYKGEARNELFVKITSVFYLISGGNYWVAALYYSLISFFASWYFVLSVKHTYPKYELAAIIAFLFWPSVVFWSSGVLKDSLINASLFFIAGLSLRYLKGHRFKWIEILLFTLSLILLFYLKHYLFGVCLVLLGILAWAQQLLPLIHSRPLKIGSSLIILAIVIVLASFVNPRLNFDQLPQTILTNYQTLIENSRSATIIFTDLQPTWGSILFHLPESLFSGLFRPFLWEVSPQLLPFAFESALVFLLTIINLRYIQSIRINLSGWLAVLLILILASFLPLVSPNFGSLVRYKVAYLPFLILLLSATPIQRLIDKRRIV